MPNSKSKAAQYYLDPLMLEKYYGEIEYFLFRKNTPPSDFFKLLNDSIHNPEMVAKLLEEQGKDAFLKARDVMFEVDLAENEKEILRLAKKALKLHPACADAYVHLSRLSAKSNGEERELLLRGMQAAKEFFGGKFFKSFKGQFNSVLLTKPYMLLLEEYASVCWEGGDKKQAIKTLYEILEYDRRDWQGVRFVLLPKLLSEKKYAEAEKLMQRFKNEDGASWLYSKAYILYKNPKTRRSARAAVAKAFGQNPFVVDFLVGKQRLPEYPERIHKGLESEAIAYVHESIEQWAMDTEAALWLLDEFINFSVKITLPEAPKKKKR